MCNQVFDSRRFCNLHFAFRATNLFGNFFARQSATAYFSGEVRLLQQYQPCPETFCNANLHEPLSVSKRIVSQRSGKYRQAIRVCLKSAFAVTRQQICLEIVLHVSLQLRIFQVKSGCCNNINRALKLSVTQICMNLFPYQNGSFHNVVASIGRQFVSV